jgi:Zn ribbon nucleic-acid-binding protein
MSIYYVECEQCGYHDWQPDDVAATDAANTHEDETTHVVFVFLESSGGVLRELERER